MKPCTLQLRSCRAHSRGRLAWAAVATAILAVVVLTTQHIRRIEASMALTERERADRRVYVLPDALDADIFERVLEAARALPFVRRHTAMRRGEAVSSHTLRREAPLILDAIRDAGFVARVHAATGMRLQLMPRIDENHISVLRYSQPGDGIDAHYDGNVYIGSRWVGILVLEDDGDATLALEGETLPSTLAPNTLVLFEGDVTKHRVTRRARQGSRIVLNILLCDVCAPRTDVWSKVWSSVVSHLAFY
jgi:hypothetical protein